MDNLLELPKDKQPPRGLLDKPFQLADYLEHVWDTGDKKDDKEFIEFNLEEAE